MKNFKDENVGDNKGLREQPFMPFGSLMNSYGNVNQGKGVPINQFVADAKQLFALSKEFVKEQYEMVENKKSTDDDKLKKEAFGGDDDEGGLFNSL